MENTTKYENSRLSVNSAVAEITNIISQHLTKVFDQVANKNDDISQNLKILNQLSFVVELRKENQDLKQRLNTVSTKYESCLEELIMIKSQAKVTMEITELDSIHNTSILSELILSQLLKIHNISLYGIYMVWTIIVNITSRMIQMHKRYRCRMV
jgi:hypothetical protein